MSSWFHSYEKNETASLRLFCFHYGGGGPSAFRDWHQYLPSFVEVNCVQLPGREARFKDPLVSDLSLIIDNLRSEIIRLADKPFVFFGHSVGSLISYHLALDLQRRHLSVPNHFVTSGRSAPKDNHLYYEKIAQLPDEEFLLMLPQYGGTPKSLLDNSELMKLYLPILRSDFLLSETRIEEEIKLECPISVFGGLGDRVPEERMGMWSEESTASCNVYMFPGGHFFIKESKTLVLDRLKNILIDVDKLVK